MLLMALGLMAVPVTAVGVAYACTALAVAETNVRTAAVGDTITVSGKFFAPHDPADIRTSPAIIRMDRIDGPALAQASPGSNSAGGTFSVDITVPATDAGEHVVIVTQNRADGTPAYGTPARTVLSVTPAPAAAQAAAAAPAPAPAPAVAAPLATPFPAAETSPAPAARTGPTRAQRIAACKRRFRVSSAKTQRGRRRIASRRTSCIRTAIRTRTGSI